VCLGLNGNEANILARIFLLPEARDAESTGKLAARLRDSLGISRVVVHRPNFAVEACETGVASTAVTLCEKPAKSTGAGDRFNAGYILGLLSGCGAETRLQTACAVSGFFVRNGHSPSRAELENFPRKPPSDS